MFHLFVRIPAERLLVFHPSEGWEPLCKFLALPVPDKPFPKINDGKKSRLSSTGLSLVNELI